LIRNKENNKTFSPIFETWHTLKKRRKRQLFFLFLFTVITGLTEIVSLASVIPFLTILNNPIPFWGNKYVIFFRKLLNISSIEELILLLTISFVFSAIAAAIVRLINLWLNSQLAAAIGSDLSSEVYKRYLYSKYVTHSKRQTSQLIANTTSQCDLTVDVITYFLNFCTALVVICSIITALIVIQPFIAFVGALVLGSVYYAITKFSKKRLRRHSVIQAQETEKRIKIQQESYGGIRDVILNNNQLLFFEMYKKSDRSLRKARAESAFISNYPRFTIEAIGIVLMAILAYISVSNSPNESNLFPIALIGSFALGAQRLLPAMQQLYNSIAAINASYQSLKNVINVLKLDLEIQQIKNIVPISIKQKIEFIDVNFSYTKNTKILQNLNFTIKKGEIVGIIGPTGGGKSTLIDILMGLLSPSSGEVRVDNINVNSKGYDEKIIPWQSSISHVPQDIYLIDASIAENIAFGEKRNEIDMDRVKKVANKASIANFIESTKYQYKTNVGENGILLSGGQKQRIALARALYNNASLLILDEATSALDLRTEELVMNSIYNLKESLTLIIIAHRLTTLRRCNKIIQIKDGKITKIGLPNEIL
jgi:ATP-binding cassette subfamily B protein